jgi:hypothetical protein
VPLGGLNARFEAQIDAHDVVLVHQGETYHGELRIAFASFIPGVQPVSSPVTPFDLNLSAQDLDKALVDGIVLSQNLKLNEDATAIRLVVVDRSSRAVGSVTVPVLEKPSGEPQ